MICCIIEKLYHYRKQSESYIITKKFINKKTKK